MIISVILLPLWNFNRKWICHLAAFAACLQIEWSTSGIRLHFFAIAALSSCEMQRHRRRITWLTNLLLGLPCLGYFDSHVTRPSLHHSSTLCVQFFRFSCSASSGEKRSLQPRWDGRYTKAAEFAFKALTEPQTLCLAPGHKSKASVL